MTVVPAGSSGSPSAPEGDSVPFKSEKQRRFLYAKHPKIAKRWAKEGKRSQGKRSKKR